MLGFTYNGEAEEHEHGLCVVASNFGGAVDICDGMSLRVATLLLAWTSHRYSEWSEVVGSNRTQTARRRILLQQAEVVRSRSAYSEPSFGSTHEMDGHSNAQSSQSSSSASSIEHATAALRLSVDSDRDTQDPSLTNGKPNGHTANGSEDSEDADLDPVERLQRELERTKGEKDVLASQYRTLLSKLTTMRTTLGNKLQQDAVSLPRRILPFVPHSTNCGLGRARPTRTNNPAADGGG